MAILCPITRESFTVSPAEQEYCQKNNLPLPMLAPLERWRQMLVFRNRPFLYNGTCAFSKKPILTCIPPENKGPVYDVDVFESDAWNPLDYGRDYDFNRSFFAQFAELYGTVPKPNLGVLKNTMEGSDYTNGITGAKNCYLIFGCSYCEDCLFSRAMWRSKNIVDGLLVFDSELCYDCRDIDHCFNLRWSEHCQNCSDSSFLVSCQNCRNCFGCVNLANKEYCFFNQQLTKEQYQAKLAAANNDFGSYRTLQHIKAEFQKFCQKFPVKYYYGKNNEASSGNFMNNNKNTTNGFIVNQCEDVENGLHLSRVKSSFNYVAYGNDSELIYSTTGSGDNCYNVKFCVDCWMNVHDLEYCHFSSFGSNNCFGCAGLKKNSYCILNKQYSKEDYLELVSRIKKQMQERGEYGQQFPMSLSPFYYNQSEAFNYLPLTREEVLRRGGKWLDEKPEKNSSTYLIPDNIKDVPDSIINETLVCEKSGKKYRITSQELAFYRRNNIPVPRVAPLERIMEKSRLLEIHPLKPVNCAKCGQTVETMLDPQTRPIYCEKCYLKEVY